MEQLNNLTKSLKSHQCNALFILSGIVLGACLHYLFNSSNMNYVREKSYEQGRKDAEQEIIQGVLSADTTWVTENEIQFIYR